MAISDWPEQDQPRFKLLDKGPAALSDTELLAIFLRTGVKGKSAVDLARDLVTEFGGLRALLQADESRFCQAKGLGEAKYVQLQAVMEIAKRHMAEGITKGQAFSDPVDVKRYLQSKMRDYQREVFSCLFLDSRHRVIQFEEIFYGTINQTAVYPREIVKRSLSYNAAAVIFAHNHPSGHCEPSDADRQITKTLVAALNLVDVRVLDHFIVGEGEVVSFAERGLV